MTYVTLTSKGKQVMEDLYPRFHKGEVDIVTCLSADEQLRMTKLLRKVIRENQF